eukprot:m.100856 g.100856  ORF g.100856 m.100856 type:complete len:448 (+) comp15142_c1_seq6:1726-3069(+)
MDELTHPFSDAWTQEELPYVLTFPVYVCLIAAVALLTIIVARVACCFCCTPSRDNWWFSEPFLSTISTDVYLDTAAELTVDPQDVFSTIIHTLFVTLVWALLANAFNWASYQQPLPLFTLATGPERASLMLNTACPPSLTFSVSNTNRVIGTTVATPFDITIRFPLENNWSPFGNRKDTTEAENPKTLDVCFLGIYDTMEQFEVSKQGCLVNVVKRGATIYLEPWQDLDAHTKAMLDDADKYTADDQKFRFEVDVYEELAGSVLRCRSVHRSTAYVPRMHRLVYLLLLLVSWSVGDAVTMTLSLWLSAIAAYLILTWMANRETPRLTMCVRIMAIAGLYINANNYYLDLLRAVGLGTWLGELMMQDHRPTPPTIHWLALPILGSIIASYAAKYLAVSAMSVVSVELWFSSVMWLTWVGWVLDIVVAVIMIRTLILVLEYPVEEVEED